MYFQITISNVNDVDELRLVDTLSTGLTFGSITSVTLDGTTLTTPTDYTVSSTDSGFIITFVTDSTVLSAATDDSTIVVTYTATVNSSAAVYSEANTNSAKVEYGQNYQTSSTPSEAKTYTYEFDLTKTDGTKKLKGAEFTLSYNNEAIAFVIESDGTYRVATDAEIDSQDVTTTTTITADSVTISGLDANKTYTLTETKAPEGYNLLTNTVTVTIGIDGTITLAGNGASQNSTTGDVEIVNNAGSKLPSTGGIGTTIFYVVGGALVIGAVVLLITKKHMSE